MTPTLSMASKENTPVRNGNCYVKELVFKILIIGDFGVGKTAIIRRYTEGQFSPFYKLTIGVDFAIKSLNWDENTRTVLQLWDIAGHERFGYMTRVYYKYAIAAVIVFDLSRPATFDSVIKWHQDVKDKVTLQDGEPIPVLLLANKCDIPGLLVQNDVLTRFCQQFNILGWFYTSAKDDINISDAMHFLVEKLIQLQTEYDSPSSHLSIKEDKSNDTLQLKEESVKQKKCGCS